MAGKTPKQQQFHKRLRLLLHSTARLGAALVTIAMLLAALMVVIHRDSLTLDPIRRWVTYGSVKKDQERQTQEFAFFGDSTNAYASVSGGFLVCSRSSLQIYDHNGQNVVSMSVSMKEPVVQVDGGEAVVYDVGGQELYQFSGTEKVFSYTAKDTSQLLSARVNQSGYLAVVEQTAGHEASVTVYGGNHQPLIGINETRNFVTDAVISPNNRYVALSEIYQNEGEMYTNLVIYRLSDAHVSSTCKLEEELVLDMKWDDERIWLQRESGVTVCDGEGTILDSWNDSGRYLEGYSLDGIGCAVELVSRYRSGSAGDLRVIDRDGQQTVSRRISEEVLSISAAGTYIAVLTTSSITIYQDDLQLYATAASSNARHAIMQKDGSVYMIGNETVRLFLP